MTATERPSFGTARPTRLAPGTTIKRLPWLDGKTPQALSATPHDDDPSPTTRPSSHRPSISTVPRRTATSTGRLSGSAPVTRKKLVSSPAERRMLAVGSPLESSPSPVTRHLLAQTRRGSTAQHASFHSTSASHEARKRLSFTHTFDQGVTEEAIKHRPRADSLAPVPDHLERSSTSESVQLPIDTTPPAVVSRVQMSPSRPRPGRSAFERMGGRRISNAIEDLEDLVQEAVEIADDTADHGQVEEIYEIIEDARQAIQDASGDPVRHLMATSSPLPASGSSESASDWENYGGYLSPTRPGRTSPAPPQLVYRNTVDDSINLVPSQVQIDLQRGSASVDWAYQPHKRSSKTSSLSSLSSSDGTNHSRLSTRSDLLLPPDPTQAATREHVDFVLRPMARADSRGRSRRRITREPAVRDRKHRHHRRLRSRSTSDREARSRPVRQHERQDPSKSGNTEESFDEEDLPRRQYGEDLRVREQARQHTFSLRRHHRRQPIARNWGTGKKRLTAIIACINTALLGIIIGVYVSGPLVAFVQA